MSFIEQQRKRAIALRDSLLNDPGQGVFFGKPREFVLDEPIANLWAGIREDAMDYFSANNIVWWGGTNEPTGHLLSSQIACVNHLYSLRQRPDLATAVLKGIDPAVESAVVVDDGFVEFEFIGQSQYLDEKSWSRGINTTSVDAVMIGECKDGLRRLYLIEWKYTESYPSNQSKYIPERARVYDHLIKSTDSPFLPGVPTEAFYYEPFYQMMRQTLLAWQATQNCDHGCSDYLHIHVIPEQNAELLGRVTSPYLTGSTLTDAWKGALRCPEKYRTLSPESFMSACAHEKDCQSLLSYLRARYW